MSGKAHPQEIAAVNAKTTTQAGRRNMDFPEIMGAKLLKYVQNPFRNVENASILCNFTHFKQEITIIKHEFQKIVVLLHQKKDFNG